MKQLSLLPEVDDTGDDRDRETAAPANPTARAELHVSLLERGVRLSLAGTGPGGIRNLGTATLEVAPPVRVESAMGDGLLPVPRDGLVDVGGAFFRLPLRLAREVIDGQPGADGQLATMEGDLGRAAAHLSSLLVPRGIAAARAFEDPATWWEIYKVAADDPTGRMAQLAETCPGLLRFLLTLPAEASRPVVEGVLAGHRLNRLLDEAAEAWMRWHVENGPAARCRRLPPADDLRRMVANQRVRVRRAGPMVSREVLLMPPPPVLVPEDIPREPGRNRDWFVVTSVWGLPWTDWWRWGDLPSVDRDGLSRFLSRQWPGLCEHAGLSPADEPWEVMRFVLHLADYVRDTGRELDRRTGARRVVQELHDWNAGLGPSRKFSPHAELQTHGLTAWQGPEGTIRPLVTAGEMVEESRTMGHCVASMAHLGVEGQAVFLHGEIEGRPVTVEVAPVESGFRLVEARGVRDRLLTAGEREVIGRWLQEVNAGSGQPGRKTAWEDDDDIRF